MICMEPWSKNISKEKFTSGEEVRGPSFQDPDESMMCLPNITYDVRSWVSIPSNVIRPFVSSTVGDVFILARRLGMRWEVLRISDVVMCAEEHE